MRRFIDNNYGCTVRDIMSFVLIKELHHFVTEIIFTTVDQTENGLTPELREEKGPQRLILKFPDI